MTLGAYQDDMIRLVRKEARQQGVLLSRDDALDVLWEHTGFPSFFEGDRDTWFRWQVRFWLANRRTKPCACESLASSDIESHDVSIGLHHPRCSRRKNLSAPR